MVVLKEKVEHKKRANERGRDLSKYIYSGVGKTKIKYNKKNFRLHS